ncbi:MAG: ABC transporter ATP-binding protein [Planctomycetes bacterium]|nr:ABC transporter ATP-binding protein [Planctomycetota bacterium]
MLELQGIEKAYGTPQNPVPVLRGVDLCVREGDYVAIVGASGSGKSTLLNILGCLDRPTNGSYFLVGEDVATLDDLSLSRVRKTRIGFVFQSFQLVSHLTVEENVELPLLYARVPRKERRERSRALIEKVGLGHRGDHLPTMLSGGECQRAAIARALVNEPALILADEPTGNLDSKTSKEIMKLFVELHGSGRTIVMITHDPNVAAVAERRITLRDGMVASNENQRAAVAAEEAECSAN